MAYIHPEAQIGENVTIDAFAWIGKDVVIGDGTWIGANATIMDGARIGKNCRIFPGAVISAIPQDLKFKGEITTAEVGDNTTVRECATINRGTAAKGKTVVGSNCLIMAYAHVAHDAIVGNSVILGNGVQLAGEVEVDDHAILSAHTLVHQFVRIGAHVMISGGSLVRKDVPPFVKAGHDPLSYVGINSIGLRRRQFTTVEIGQIQDIFRILYQSGFIVSKAVEAIIEEVPQSEFRDYIVNFVKNSKRGIIKGYTGRAKSEDLDF